MHHARPDFERHGDAVGSRLLRDSDTVVAEHFVLTGLNQDRRQTTKVAKHRRRQRISRIGHWQVAIPKLGHGPRADDRVVNRLQRLARQGEVRSRRDRDRPCRKRAFAFLECQQRCQRQISSGGVTGDKRRFGGARTRWSIGDKPVMCGDTVIESRGKRMLGSQSIIRPATPHILRRARFPQPEADNCRLIRKPIHRHAGTGVAHRDQHRES